MMRSSLKKLRDFAGLRKNESKEKTDRHHPHSSAQLDELAQASQDMQDIRCCYDNLLSAAAATTNSAYEFSESLRELGTCLLEKTALSDDEESGRALLMLGKAQLEIQKLLDSYRSQIVQTITTPSESLLSELQTVEEMKRQCDEKRELFEYMLASHKDKGKSRNSKEETFSSHQIQAAQEEYDQEATLFVFRLKSLKQGRSRSLLTQALRHHAAQLSFFRKANKSLEAVEPHVKLVAEQQHIDYQFNGLEDDETDDDIEYCCNSRDVSELSFHYEQNEQGEEVVSTSRNSMDLDQMVRTSATIPKPGTSQESIEKFQMDHLSSSRLPRPVSQSAPLFPDKKFDPAEKFPDKPSTGRKFHTYVLPTPVDCKNSKTTSSGVIPVALQESRGGWSRQLWHSSPLEPEQNVEVSRHDQFSGPAQSLKAQLVLKDSNINSELVRIPPPLVEGLFLPQLNPDTASDTKKIKRQAFSGPMTSKAQSNNLRSAIPSIEYPPADSMPMHIVMSQSSKSPKLSPNTSPPMSSPKISELHELPRPPLNSA